MKRKPGAIGSAQNPHYNPGMKVLAFAASIALIGGCATHPTAEPVPADKIPVYESVTGSPKVAAVVKRLWADSWVTAFNVPSYTSAGEAAADLKERAAALGGNGVVNFGCYRQTDAPDSRLWCNGNVVRFK